MEIFKRMAVLHAIFFVTIFTGSVCAKEIGTQPMDFLLGEWRGVGTGKWGTSAAELKYERLYEGVFIHGIGRSVYPKQKKNPSGEIHKTFDLYSFDKSLGTVVLRQFDNEGYVTTYYLNKTSSSDSRLEFVSSHLENVPSGWRARLTFEIKSDEEFVEYFELDTGKGKFENYLTNKFLRVSN